MYNKKQPRNIFILLYLFFNTYFLIYYYNDGFLGGDLFGEYEIKNKASLIYGYLSILVPCLFLFLFFNWFEKVNIFKSQHLNKKGLFYLDIIILLLGVFYFYGCLKGYYVSLDFSGGVQRPFIFSIIYAVFPIDILLVIYLFYVFRENRSILYKINFFIILAIYLYSGRTGIFLMLFMLLLIFFGRNNKNISYVKVIGCIFLGLSLYPFIRPLKEYVPAYILYFRDKGEPFFSGYLDVWMKNDFATFYLEKLNSSLERFQQISNVTYLIDNYHQMNNFLLSKTYYIYSFNWFDLVNGVINNYKKPVFFNNLLAQSINGSDAWAAQSGVSGLIFISNESYVIYIFVSLVLIIISIYLSKKLDVKIIQLTWLSMVLYIMHGWISAYILYVEALIVFSVIVFFLKFKNK
ncbi:TPA: oligosaccharide repeat unit polymerase [Photobacterium damselae]